MTTKKSCVSCASKIPTEAKKCVSCGSYQDIRRHFDVGNTAIALLLALISVVALSFDKLKEVYEYFFNYESEINIFVDKIDTQQISILAFNKGGSTAMLGDEINCSVPILKTKTAFCNRYEFCVDRKPSSIDEIKTIINFSFDINRSSFLGRNQQVNINAIRLRRPVDISQSFKTLETPGYCSFRYLGQSGEEKYSQTDLKVEDLFQFIDFEDYEKYPAINKKE
jgi:hypothetical protein